ncbi:MAG TPA: hypothetical protein VK403_08875 [Allosphingosinicella sp.]|nr:hypothetical protein [Allosphingosinicella sp.]
MLIAAIRPNGYLRLIAAAAFASLTVGAAAADGTATGIARWERPVPRGEASAITALRAYSACAAMAREAPSLLRATPGTAEEAALVRALTRGRKGCRPAGQLRMQAYLLRGAIAEALYPVEAARRGLTLTAASPVETVQVFSARLTAADPDGLDAVDRQILAWRWMAYCAAYRDPAAAGLLLRTLPSGHEELAALRVLQPALEACLAPERWADLRAVAIRALIADALYRRLSDSPA